MATFLVSAQILKEINVVVRVEAETIDEALEQLEENADSLLDHEQVGDEQDGGVHCVLSSSAELEDLS